MAPSVEHGRKTSSNGDERDSPPNLRRSGRARKPRVLDGEKEAIVNPPPKTNGTKSPPIQNGESVRRNPKRKASEVFDVPDYLLEASLEAWKENEREDWPSWTEVESDPAFFNRILNLLGVKQASLQEVYSVDADSLASLPLPVYGLIFLYQYVDREDDTDPSEVGPDLWFANQTTSNACATVALFNIIMNAEGLELGDKLDKFKQASKDLSPPLRGNMLSNSTWIRVAHNSFARRLELLNAALGLQNRVEASESKRQANKPKIKPSKKKPAPKKPDDDAGYHFIAFIPMHQKVWQLDGLEANPRCIGEFQPDQHWTSIVSPELAARMIESETQMLSFNLLALHGDVDKQTNGEAETIPGRRKDHTPAIHEWVKKLADHGALAQLHDEAKLRKSP